MWESLQPDIDEDTVFFNVEAYLYGDYYASYAQHLLAITEQQYLAHEQLLIFSNVNTSL